MRKDPKKTEKDEGEDDQNQFELNDRYMLCIHVLHA